MVFFVIFAFKDTTSWHKVQIVRFEVQMHCTKLFLHDEWVSVFAKHLDFFSGSCYKDAAVYVRVFVNYEIETWGCGKKFLAVVISKKVDCVFLAYIRITKFRVKVCS